MEQEDTACDWLCSLKITYLWMKMSYYWKDDFVFLKTFEIFQTILQYFMKCLFHRLQSHTREHKHAQNYTRVHTRAITRTYAYLL